MKTIIIIILVLAVAGLSYVQFFQDETPEKPLASATETQTLASAETEKPTAPSGKTIDLSNQGLTQVPSNILDNSSITTLDVSGNNLTGALPGEIRKLTNLQVLNASDNKLTGIPGEIGQLSKLQTANFANNNISGLPQEIGNLKNLVTLDLRGNPNVSKQDLSQIQSKIPKAKILTD